MSGQRRRKTLPVVAGRLRFCLFRRAQVVRWRALLAAWRNGMAAAFRAGRAP
eukprot:gene692-10567_t